MIVEAFKNKWFIGFIVIASLVGGIIGLIGSEIHERKIENAELVQLIHYYNPEWNYIPGIMDTNYKEEYMEFILDTSLSSIVNFPIRSIPTTGHLYLLDLTQDSTLALIGRENDNPTMADPRYQELWVWVKHVRKK